MSMTLVNPTDDELNRAFAERVAGIVDIHTVTGRGMVYCVRTDRGPEERTVPNYCRSADAVLPWLEKNGWKGTSNRAGSTCMATVSVVIPEATKEPFEVVAQQDWTHTQTPFPRAAVIALLRAHGVEVEITK